MSALKAVVEGRVPHYGPVSDFELQVGIAYAKKEYERDLDQHLLRVMVNTTFERRKPGMKLALLAATVVRELVPARDKAANHAVDGYKGAVMKIMSDRSHKARRKKPKQKATKHPCDYRIPGQYRLI